MAARAPDTVGFAIGGRLERGDAPALCGRLEEMLRRDPAEVVVCDVAGLSPDAVTLDTLARLQLIARRYGCELRLRRAASDLLEVVALAGLRDVLPTEVNARAAGGGRRAERDGPCRGRT